MPGVKGRSGAPGVSRKAGPGRLPHKRSIQVGKKFAVKREWPDGSAPLEMWTVTALDRTHITLAASDGSTITLIN